MLESFRNNGDIYKKMKKSRLITPSRTHRISGIKSQVLKQTLKMMMRIGPEFLFFKKIPLAPLKVPREIK